MRLITLIAAPILGLPLLARSFDAVPLAGRPGGAYSISFYSTGNQNTATTVRVEMDYQAAGANEPTSVSAQVTIPAGTTAEAAAQLVADQLSAQADIPEEDIRTAGNLVWVRDGVKAGGIATSDPAGLQVNAEPSGGAETKAVKTKIKPPGAGPLLTQVGTVEFALTGYDASGLLAWDSISVAIPANLTQAQLDDYLVAGLTAAGWDVTLVAAGEYAIDSGVNVVNTVFGSALTRGSTGFTAVMSWEE